MRVGMSIWDLRLLPFYPLAVKKNIIPTCSELVDLLYFYY